MTVSLVILATMFLIGSHSVFGADGNAKPVDEEFLRGYRLENMTSSGARLIRLQLTRDM